MYLVDTNILILASAGQEPDSGFLNEIIEENKLALSVMVIAEFLTRATVKEQRALNNLISSLPIIDIDLQTAKLAADYRKHSLKKTRVSLLDCLLAAQAKQHKLILVTNNITDFPMKDIKIVKPN